MEEKKLLIALLIILAVVSALQFVQLVSLNNNMAGGTRTAVSVQAAQGQAQQSPQATQSSQGSSLPSMVGGC